MAGVQVQNSNCRISGKNIKLTTYSGYAVNIKFPIEPYFREHPVTIEKFKGDYYVDSEVLELFEILKGHKMKLIVLLTAFYGLCRSEVLRLKWSAFDFFHDCFTIRHTVTACRAKGEKVVVKKDRAKNKSSRRTYPLIPFIKDRLLEAKKQQDENKRRCGRSYNKENIGYICVDAIGDLIKPNYVSCTVPKLLA